jgi:hypothetical protein
VSQHLLVDFCLRLAAGMSCMTVVALRHDIGRHFFRTLALVELGLCVLAWLNVQETDSGRSLPLAISAVLCFVAFVLWTLGRTRPAAYVSAVLLLLLVWCLILAGGSGNTGTARQLQAGAVQLSSALLLGSTVSAMLLGHTYLVAPTMSIEPLRQLVWWIAGSIAARAIIACIATASGSQAGGELSMRLSGQFGLVIIAARWIIGLVGPAILAWMVWQTARIRATQSATGILYAAVIMVFLGELLGELIGV